MELPKRKHPRLKHYDYSQAGAYFITICSKNKQHIFGRIVGRGAFTAPYIELSSYGKIVDRYIQTIPGIVKYVIMPNHVHMIIEIVGDDGVTRASRPTQSIPTRIASFKSLVSKGVGRPIWQHSFHDHIIRNALDYQNIWTYIDENPVRWETDCYYTAETGDNYE